MKTTTESTLRAFHGDPKIKAKFLKRVRAHRAADEIVKGQYWEGGKGCAVGCTIHSGLHSTYPEQLGMPTTLAHLEDMLFERLPNELAMTWPERFLMAPTEGADLTLVPHRFAVWLLTSPDSVFQKVVKDKDALKIFADVAGLYQRYIDGDKPSDADWDAVIERASVASAKAWDAYHASARALALALALDLDRALALALARALALALALDLDLALDLALALDQREKFLVLASEKLLQLMSEAPVPGLEEVAL